MNGLLFPGQGSQSVGMGKELYESLVPARKILDEACEILGYDLKKIMFEGPQEQLTDTCFAQPAIYTCSAMYLEKLKYDGIGYDIVAGHSLGEYNALLAAGVFSFEDGLKLVARRGYEMGLMNGKGCMAAVIGLTEEELRPFLNSEVYMANLNSKMQIVISGTENGINDVGKRFEGNEKVEFKRLRVSAAFHSPQMQETADVMKELIHETKFNEPVCSVIPNVSGIPSKDKEEIRECLIKQITGQVRWYDTIIAMKKAGVETLYEVGHGDVLKKLNKTIVFRPKCIGITV